MNQIALLADNTTVTCFKLAGITNVFPINNQKDAKKILLELLNDKKLKIILITNSLLNETQLIDEISEHQYPIIIPIPEVLMKKKLKVDLISEMIKRKTEVKWYVLARAATPDGNKPLIEGDLLALMYEADTTTQNQG